jgi:hypothetical protein
LETARSTLEHATDTRLGREVVLEKIARPDDAHLAWLRAMARAGGPHLQRVLRIERLGDGGVRAVFEAVNGRPVNAAARSLSDGQRAQLRAALAPLHATGTAHGALASSLVLEESGPTILVAGRAPTGASPADDLAALTAL